MGQEVEQGACDKGLTERRTRGSKWVPFGPGPREGQKDSFWDSDVGHTLHLTPTSNLLSKKGS